MSCELDRDTELSEDLTGMAMLALVIEDDTGLRLIYRRVLERQDFEVLEAADGQIALNILAQTTPHIIFLDMLLPLVSGVTILNTITTTPRLSRVKTVIVSSNKQFAQMIEPGQPVEFVLKPIRPAQIRAFAEAIQA